MCDTPDPAKLGHLVRVAAELANGPQATVMPEPPFVQRVGLDTDGLPPDDWEPSASLQACVRNRRYVPRLVRDTPRSGRRGSVRASGPGRRSYDKDEG